MDIKMHTYVCWLCVDNEEDVSDDNTYHDINSFIEHMSKTHGVRSYA